MNKTRKKIGMEILSSYIDEMLLYFVRSISVGTSM